MNISLHDEEIRGYIQQYCLHGEIQATKMGLEYRKKRNTKCVENNGGNRLGKRKTEETK